MKHINKRAVLDNIGALVMSLGVFAILMAVIFLIMAEVDEQVLSQNPCEQAAGSSETYAYYAGNDTCYNATDGAIGGHSATYNATYATKTAAMDIPNWLPIIVITVIGGILLLLIGMFRRNQ